MKINLYFSRENKLKSSTDSGTKLPARHAYIKAFMASGIVLFLLVSGPATQAQFSKKGFHQLKQIKKNFVQVNETLYACKYETANIDYLIFLDYIKNRLNQGVYMGLLPDTARWNDQGLRHPNYATNYFRFKAYANYPVVNISYEQANFYCTWLTQQYNKDPKRKFKKVVFKIPSRSEWQEAAASGNMKNSYPWGSELKDKPGNMVVNYCKGDYDEKIWVDSVTTNENKKVKSTDSILVHSECHPYKKPYYTQAVNNKKAKQNSLGLYHIVGNVSEMVSVKGEAAGGNFRSREFWLKLDSGNEFHPGYLPCPLLGFRVFMQVMEK